MRINGEALVESMSCESYWSFLFFLRGTGLLLADDIILRFHKEERIASRHYDDVCMYAICFIFMIQEVREDKLKPSTCKVMYQFY